MSLCLSVCQHSHGRISWSLFAKSGRKGNILQSKNTFVGAQHLTNTGPQNCYLDTKGPKIHANITTPISALNVRKSPEFRRHEENRDPETQRWRQISDRK